MAGQSDGQICKRGEGHFLMPDDSRDPWRLVFRGWRLATSIERLKLIPQDPCIALAALDVDEKLWRQAPGSLALSVIPATRTLENPSSTWRSRDVQFGARQAQFQRGWRFNRSGMSDVSAAVTKFSTHWTQGRRGAGGLGRWDPRRRGSEYLIAQMSNGQRCNRCAKSSSP